jgi:hypothetical protein
MAKALPSEVPSSVKVAGPCVVVPSAVSPASTISVRFVMLIIGVIVPLLSEASRLMFDCHVEGIARALGIGPKPPS